MDIGKLAMPKLPKLPHIPSRGESVFAQVVETIDGAQRMLDDDCWLVVTHATPAGESLSVETIGWDAGILILKCVNASGEKCIIIVGIESLHLTLTFVEKNKLVKGSIGFAGFTNKSSAG